MKNEMTDSRLHELLSLTPLGRSMLADKRVVTQPAAYTGTAEMPMARIRRIGQAVAERLKLPRADASNPGHRFAMALIDRKLAEHLGDVRNVGDTELKRRIEKFFTDK